MTDDQDTTEETPARPVRVPNVSAHAKSGLDHTVIGSAAIDAYDAEYGENAAAPEPEGEETSEPDEVLPEIPEETTTVEALLEWVHEADGDEQKARARAVLAAEEDRLEPRVTLVEPLQAIVDAPPEEETPPEE